MGDLATLSRQALDEVAASSTLAALEEVRVRWLGKKGPLTEQLKALGTLPAAERPGAGALINEVKQRVQQALELRRELLSQAAVEAITAVTGAAPQLSTGGGTSDGRFIAPLGAQVVELGVTNATIHKVNECVRVEEIGLLHRMYRGVLERLLA